MRVRDVSAIPSRLTAAASRAPHTFMDSRGVPLAHYRDHGCGVRLTCRDCMVFRDLPLQPVLARLAARGRGGRARRDCRARPARPRALQPLRRLALHDGAGVPGTRADGRSIAAPYA